NAKQSEKYVWSGYKHWVLLLQDTEVFAVEKPAVARPEMGFYPLFIIAQPLMCAKLHDSADSFLDRDFIRFFHTTYLWFSGQNDSGDIGIYRCGAVKVPTACQF
ncbi:MAG: hypothetical protein COA84_15680, partial [Robiginitomaculum sp.]